MTARTRREFAAKPMSYRAARAFIATHKYFATPGAGWMTRTYPGTIGDVLCRRRTNTGKRTEYEFTRVGFKATRITQADLIRLLMHDAPIYIQQEI